MELVEKLFKDAAGSNEEIDWTELKAILDGSIPQGKFKDFHYFNQYSPSDTKGRSSQMAALY